MLLNPFHQILEQAASSIGLHVDAHKTEYMCFNQTDDISTLYGNSLKLVDKFTYLGSSVSSTKKDINTRLMKAAVSTLFGLINSVYRDLHH